MKNTVRIWRVSSLLSALIRISMSMAVVAAMLFLAVRNAHAERQLSLKDGTLTVWADVMKVTDIPKEITDPEIAFRLVSGQLKCVVIAGKTILYRPSDGDGVQYNEGPWIIIPQ